MKKTIAILFTLITTLAFSQQPKNIIIVMAHGMGYNHYELLKNYETTPLNNFDFSSGSTNYPAYSHTITETKNVKYFTGDYHGRRIWTEFSYTDSMPTDPYSAATAISTGKKTGLGAIGVDIDSSSMETILERATKLGKSTGIITDLPISKSGAAAFAAHNPSAENSNEICTSLLSSDLSVIIGAGNPLFDNNGASQTANYKYITNTDWTKAQAGDTVFTNGAKAKDITGDGIADYWTLLDSESEITDSTNNRILIMPQNFDALSFLGTQNNPINSYVNMSSLFLKGVQTLANDDDGYVAVVEYSAIDYASSLQDKDKTMQALLDFNALLNTINNYVANTDDYNETLVIVVGTYETGFVTNTEFDKNTAGGYTTNYTVSKASEGVMPDFSFQSKYQTKLLTPMFAKGPGAEYFNHYLDEEDFLLGPFINNSEIGQFCMHFLPDPNVTIQKPKNIILIIGDGVGMGQITAANYYTGKTEQYQSFPVQTFHSTYPLITAEDISLTAIDFNNSYQSSLAWTDTKYLRGRTNATCSGASVTAYSSGKKTYYYSLGVDIHANAMYSIARYAKDLNKSAGAVTNSTIADATPAGFFANNLSRNNKEEIFRQLIIESEADVLIGSGNPLFSETGEVELNPDYDLVGGEEMWTDLTTNKTTFQLASNSGWTNVQDVNGDSTPDAWTLIQDSASFAELIDGPTPTRVLGLIQASGIPQFNRTGIDPQVVHFDDMLPNFPALWQLGRVGLNVVSKNPEGFFIMIEQEATDYAGHETKKGRLIESEIELNQTIDSVISWIETNSSWDETLLIVTADHETGLIADPTYADDYIFLNHYQIIDNGPGNMPGFEFYEGQHSNQLIPLFAKGAGAEVLLNYADEIDYVRGRYMNNSEIGQAMFELWDGEACQVVNYAPIVVSDIEKIELFVGEDSTWTVDKSHFSDKEEQNLTFSITTRPAWLQYDMNTLTFSGIPDKVSNKTVKLIATDGETTGAGISIETSFIISCKSRVSIENIENNVQVYPNPASTYIHISTETENANITLYNPAGKMIVSGYLQSKDYQLDISNLPAGTYILYVKEKGKITSQPILIK